MNTVTSDTPIDTWLEVNGKYHYCFDHDEYLSKDEITGEENKVYSAKYIEVDEKNENIAKKIIKQHEINTMTVQTKSGKVFMADPASRQDLSDAISSAELLGKTSAIWKLAKGQEPRYQEITIDEAKEALALAILKKGEIVFGKDV